MGKEEKKGSDPGGLDLGEKRASRFQPNGPPSSESDKKTENKRFFSNLAAIV